MDFFLVDCCLIKDGWLKKWIIGVGIDFVFCLSVRVFGFVLVDLLFKFFLLLLLMSFKFVVVGRYGVFCLLM